MVNIDLPWRLPDEKKTPWICFEIEMATTKKWTQKGIFSPIPSSWLCLEGPWSGRVLWDTGLWLIEFDSSLCVPSDIQSLVLTHCCFESRLIFWYLSLGQEKGRKYKRLYRKNAVYRDGIGVFKLATIFWTISDVCLKIPRQNFCLHKLIHIQNSIVLILSLFDMWEKICSLSETCVFYQIWIPSKLFFKKRVNINLTIYLKKRII